MSSAIEIPKSYQGNSERQLKAGDREILKFPKNVGSKEVSLIIVQNDEIEIEKKNFEGNFLTNEDKDSNDSFLRNQMDLKDKTRFNVGDLLKSDFQALDKFRESDNSNSRFMGNLN